MNIYVVGRVPSSVEQLHGSIQRFCIPCKVGVGKFCHQSQYLERRRIGGLVLLSDIARCKHVQTILMSAYS